MRKYAELEEHLVGKRVVIIRLVDDNRDDHFYPGLEGTVRFVDDAGTVHVAWDSGSNLGLIEGDTWKLVDPNITFET